MIGKFLEEEKSSEIKPESNSFKTEEKPSADIFTLPQTPENDSLNIENKLENSVFSENENYIEPQILSENKDYTVAPAEALIPVNTQTETKTESLTPETTAENLRKTGLAWSAATVLGGSVIFMMILGWFFDLVFGSKPWGIVGGIVIGAIVGFIQFFRITSQIFKNEKGHSTGILDNED